MTYVRYLVTDVQKAVDFYSSHLGFTVKQQFPAMAILTRGDLTLWLSGPQGSDSQPMPDGPGDEGSYPDNDLRALLVGGRWKFVHKDGSPCE